LQRKQKLSLCPGVSIPMRRHQFDQLLGNRSPDGAPYRRVTIRRLRECLDNFFCAS